MMVSGRTDLNERSPNTVNIELNTQTTQNLQAESSNCSAGYKDKFLISELEGKLKTPDDEIKEISKLEGDLKKPEDEIIKIQNINIKQEENKTPYQFRLRRKMKGFYDENVDPIVFEYKESFEEDIKPPLLFKQETIFPVNDNALREYKPLFRQQEAKFLEHETELYSENFRFKQENFLLETSSKLPVSTPVRHNLTERLCRCSVCGKGFCRLTDLHLHTIQHRNRNSFQVEKPSKTTYRIVGRLFKCFHCGKGFSRSKDLTKHLKNTKASANEELADLTGRGVNNAETVLEAPDIKTEFKPTKRQDVKSKILTRSCCILQKHKTNKSKQMSKRLKLKSKSKVTCLICQKSYDEHNLKAHSRIHTGAKPYSCKTCGKSFSQFGNMQTHMRIHTNDRPYVCPSCPLRFKQLSQVQAHFRLHQNGRGSSCQRCGALFGHIFLMERHVCPKFSKTENLTS